MPFPAFSEPLLLAGNCKISKSSISVNDKLVKSIKDLVREDFIKVFGKYFSLNLTFKIGPDDLMDQMYILLNPGFVFQILIHHPDFFIFNESPATIPMIMKYFDTRTVKSHFYRLDLTEMNKLNHRDHPCNSSPDYSFQN